MLSGSIKKHVLGLLALLILAVCAQATSEPIDLTDQPPQHTQPTGLVILDIGHHAGAGGACSPDGKLSEFSFWCKYADTIKSDIEAAGYRCEITNRGRKPTRAILSPSGVEPHIIWHNYAEKGGVRYPSKHHPQFIGAGMISADYAIGKKATCTVFLHLNATSGGWNTTPPSGLVMYAGSVGKPLAQAICHTLNTQLYDQPGGLPNKGKKCNPHQRGAHLNGGGWLHACEAAGIPAAVLEAFYVNNRQHAAYLNTQEGAERTAHTVAAGILNWLKTQQ